MIELKKITENIYDMMIDESAQGHGYGSEDEDEIELVLMLA